MHYSQTGVNKICGVDEDNDPGALWFEGELLGLTNFKKLFEEVLGAAWKQGGISWVIRNDIITYW